MLKSILKTSVYIVCMAGAGIASAAGLGGINVTSSLGQPLRAEIEVVSAGSADKSSLRAKLASPEAYKNAGADYPYNFPKLKFQIEERANGDPYFKVSTAQPVNDPFVTLMVELSWSSGKLLREYTFLLDPVDYKIEQPKPEEVRPIEPVMAVPVVEPVPEPVVVAEPAGAASEPVAAEPAAVEPLAEAPAVVETVPAVAESAVVAVPEAETAPGAEAIPVAEAAPAEQPLTEAAPIEAAPVEEAPATQDALSKEEAIAEAAPATPGDLIVVVRGDTLSKIAAQIKPANVSLERMLVALYRENAGVFDGHNMNRIRAGKILSIPSSEAAEMLPQADAEEEIRAQAADWNAYRQKLAAVRTPRVETADKQEVTGKISAAVTDKAAVSKEPPKEVLKLSKGEAPNDKAVGGGKATAQEAAIAKEEEAIAKNKALKEAEERTAILEKNVQDLKRLEELRKASAPVAASAPAAVVTMNAASAPNAVSSVSPAKPKAAPAPRVVQQPSLVDQLLGNPLYMAGGAAVLLALGGLGFMVATRGKSGGKKKAPPVKKKAEDIGSATGRIAAPVAPSPETGDFTHTAVQTAAPAVSMEPEEVDPIGEADLFLTFGRDAQAEEVLKEALKKNPNNIPVKLKLLSIYVTRKDTNSFYSYAREIKDSGDTTAWEQTASMGRELDPTNPFYGGSAAAAPAAPAAESKPAAATPAVDFDLGFGSTTTTMPNFASQKTVVLESPAASQEKTAIMSSAELQNAAQATPMDFDITGNNPGFPAANFSGRNQDTTTSLNMDDLVFDVTATHPRVSVPPLSAPAAPAKDDGMAFTLDFPTETTAKFTAPHDLGLGEISLQMDNLRPASGGNEPKDERWQEVATKLDLAKAYQEMGDVAGAREILDEVLRDGDAQQRESAQTLMQQLL